ncbi:hypothetical protein [Mycobacterium shottsii]|uniref:hypothetical protein n=1 Tax=Mycobacterium shottsii TaxID=133549 RepID=UPI0018E98CEC|nr:hypothetical protein [Mycobacterium shottsii]
MRIGPWRAWIRGAGDATHQLIDECAQHDVFFPTGQPGQIAYRQLGRVCLM